MSLQQQIAADLTAAMKARDKDRTRTLRMVVAAIKNAAVAAGSGPQGELDDAEVQRLITTEAKKRREAAQAFREGGRDASADAEEAELAILEDYLPAQLSDDELAAHVDEVIAEVGATSPKEMGQVMKGVMARVQGEADGARVSAMVKQRLTG